MWKTSSQRYMKNPESIVTDHFKNVVESLGGFYFKLSDRFTRGIPDCYVVFERGVFVEIKEGNFDGTVQTYKKLTIRGGQDHKIRQMCRRHRKNACVVTMSVGSPNDMKLWVPVRPEKEGGEFQEYRLAVTGQHKVMTWLGHRSQI